MTRNLVTIDGPSASGKSSVSRELARLMGWRWVSTGAFYRGLAFVAIKEGIAPNDVEGLVSLTTRSIWSVQMLEDQTRVFYRDRDVSQEVFSEENGSRASVISQIPRVREALLKNQRDCARGVPGLVAEGRDCGTVVFPQAPLKVYLTASEEERAMRRSREQGLDLERTQTQQKQRDEQDASRAAAPLQIPPDARVMNSSGLTLNQVVAELQTWVKEAIPGL